MTQLDRIEQKLDKLSLLIEGNGNPGHGLVMKVDRLETRAKRIDRMQGAAITAIVGGAMMVIWAMIRTSGSG